MKCLNFMYKNCGLKRMCVFHAIFIIYIYLSGSMIYRLTILRPHKVGLIARLVKHFTGIAEVMFRIPVQACFPTAAYEEHTHIHFNPQL